ncbi:MAG TPA: alkaline phosphatase [Cyclobacteriaceae bacterium]|jgi:alkaline phosphatase
MNLTKVIFTATTFLAAISCTSITREANSETVPVPKNVILIIGDGTGLSQISSAFFYKESAPNYGRFRHIGLIKTSSSRQKITDSAAGATAFASGVKTYNGAIGVADDSTSVETIVEIASRRNIQTGVIATSSITHATPACFYAHVPNRGQAENIAADMVKSEIDFLAGGGLRYFVRRRDSRNLLRELQEKGFGIDTVNLSSFTMLNSGAKLGYLLADDAMSPVLEGRGNFLPNATDLGIQFLNKNNANFFLMVEGSQVDWGGHSNNADYLITELLDMDDAIGKALDFAEKNGETLVIVTGDHETGGYTLSSTLKKTESGREYSDYNEITGTFSTDGHSGALIPVFAFGPGSEEFAGVYENTEIFHKIMKLTGWNK